MSEKTETSGIGTPRGYNSRDDEIERLTKERDEAQAWRRQFDCCMCGSTMDSHDIGSGHSPVSMYDYERASLVSELAKAREALAAIRDLPETKPTLDARHYWHQAQTIARAALPATAEPQPTKES